MRRPLVPYDGDMLIGIEGTFEWNWRRCEDLLPEDWGLQLVTIPHKGFLVYGAMAFLDDDPNVGRQTPWCSTPERALERMYYLLRDGLVAPSDTR